MSASIIQNLFAGSVTRKLPKRQIIIYEGDAIDHLYYITSGYVKVYNILNSGAERTIFIYSPGDVFPFTSYLSGTGVARYFYECMTETELKVALPEHIERKVRGDFDLGEALIHYTNTISQQFMQRIDVLSVNDAKRKIIALLDYLVHTVGTSENPSRLNVPLTIQDIADMCGLTRETTSVQLNRLRRAGVLSGSRTIAVDIAKLEKLKPRYAIHV